MAGKVALGGETLTVTILFTDIRSFTSISEKMDAHALVALLNEYFTEMVEHRHGRGRRRRQVHRRRHHGRLRRAVPKPDDAHHAVRAAVRCGARSSA